MLSVPHSWRSFVESKAAIWDRAAAWKAFEAVQTEPVVMSEG